jgi:hypothetical protein
LGAQITRGAAAARTGYDRYGVIGIRDVVVGPDGVALDLCTLAAKEATQRRSYSIPRHSKFPPANLPAIFG